MKPLHDGLCLRSTQTRRISKLSNISWKVLYLATLLYYGMTHRLAYHWPTLKRLITAQQHVVLRSGTKMHLSIFERLSLLDLPITGIGAFDVVGCTSLRKPPCLLVITHLFTDLYGHCITSSACNVLRSRRICPSAGNNSAV